MPELPDVEIWRRYVDATALHKEIGRVEIVAPRMLCGIGAEAFKKRLEHNTLASTSRHGKFLFVRLSGGGCLVLHFGMTGYLEYVKDTGCSSQYTGLLLRFSNGYRLACHWKRKLGRVSFAENPDTFIKQAGLGPDAYDPGLTRAAFVRRFRARRGGIKSALMDQKLIAGLGNIYADEILYQARVHPQSKANALDDRRLATLWSTMRHVLRLAIERQANPKRMPRSWLLPNRHRAGRCPRCRTTLQRLKVSGRTAILCPSCQRLAS
jgi:formamidopyrimidine-DNA glycosylase